MLFLRRYPLHLPAGLNPGSPRRASVPLAMLDWLRNLLGPVGRNDDVVAHIPHIEISSVDGVARLRATSIDDRVIYEVYAADKDGQAPDSILQTEDEAVAARFYIGTSHQDFLSRMDEGDLLHDDSVVGGEMIVSVAGTSIYGVVHSPTPALDWEGRVRAVLKQHIAPSSRMVCSRKSALNQEDYRRPETVSRKRVRDEHVPNEAGGE